MDLAQIYKKFPSNESCILFLEKTLWENGPVCPYCKSDNYTPLKNENRYHCNTCNLSFSVTVKTMFHKTKCDLQKWFYLMVLFNSEEALPPVRKIGNMIGVTKDTAQKMVFKLKKAFLNNRTLFDKIINNLIK